MMQCITVETLEAAADGERGAAGILFDFVYKSVKFVLQTGSGIDDASQDTFVAVLEAVRLGQYDPDEPDKSAWVRTIACRKAIDIRRGIRRRNETTEDEAISKIEKTPSSRDPEATIDRKRKYARLQKHLEELDEESRAIILLKHGHGIEERKIAEALGIPVGTVKSRNSRLLPKLRTALEEEPISVRSEDITGGLS